MMPARIASPGSTATDTGRSIEAAEEECLWFECRDDCEPAALPGGLWVLGARWVSLAVLSLWRRPKNLPADDCLPLPSCDVLEGMVCYALRVRGLPWEQRGGGGGMPY